jgi:O-methyltransferase
MEESNLGEVRQIYLDLLKRTLSHSLWVERTRPIEASRMGKGPKREIVRFITSVLRLLKIRLVLDVPVNEEGKREGRIWPEFAHTMIGSLRLNNLQTCIETIIKDKIPGDLIETGVWRGGASIFMRGVLKAYDVRDKKIWVADSFEGLPKPDAEKYPEDAGSNWYEPEFLAVSLENVKDNFRLYGLLDEQVEFLKGWFKDTLPSAPVKSLSLLRLDGDMYQSTMEGLESLYPKVSSGGFIVVDDYYAVKECQKAVDDFRSKNKISDPLKQTDWSEVSWRRSS